MGELIISSMCTGIGSFEMAMRNLKIPHKSKFAIEIDKYAKQTFLANFETETMYDDMTKEDYVGEHWYSDINVSGIPCQAFSLAGKRLGELDPRGLLFFDFYRYVKNQKPKYFIIENVKGLLSDNAGATFQNWINLLGQSVNGDPFMFPHEDSLMYNLHWQVLNTKDYGLPQNRERVFLIGIRNDLPNSFVFPKGVPLKLRLKDILEDEVDEKYYLSEKMLAGFKAHSERHTSAGNGFAFKPKNGNSIANALTARYYKMGVDDNYIDESIGADDIANCLRANAALCPTDNMIKIVGPSGTGGQRGDILSTEGISSCLSATDHKQPKQIKVQIHSATASGYEIAAEVASGERKTKSCDQAVMVSNEVRTHEAKIQRRITGTNDFRGKQIIFKEQDYMNCLQTGLTNDHFIKTDYRIRKLTPLECFRLQGFPDEFLQNAINAGVSNSQLYKQAGNSISVPVIQAILKNLLKK